MDLLIRFEIIDKSSSESDLQCDWSRYLTLLKITHIFYHILPQLLQHQKLAHLCFFAPSVART